MHSEKITCQNLTSTDQVQVAKCLAGIMLDEAQSSPKPGSDKVASKLKGLLDSIWDVRTTESYTQQQQRAKSRQLLMRNALKELPSDEMATFAELYARLGHIYEVAGQVARGNYFRRQLNADKPIAGGADDKLFGKRRIFSSAQEAVNTLNIPVFEPVLTMHPTNLLTLDTINAVRDVNSVADDIARNMASHTADTGQVERLKATMQNFLKSDFIPMRDGKDRNFNVREETDMVIQFMKNIYHDLPRVYSHFDDTLSKHFSGEYTSQLQQNLHLNICLSSWGSAGDKDGNSNIKAENTLEAIALHKRAIVEEYIKDINAIKPVSALQEWKENLVKASEKLDSEIKLLEAKRKQDPAGNDIALNPEEFDQHSKAIAAIMLNQDGFQQSIATALGAADDIIKPQLLDLLRKSRTFGFQLGRIEYRETAEEYSRVVAQIVGRMDTQIIRGLLGLPEGEEKPNYLELSTAQREKLLTGLLEEGRTEALQSATRQVMDAATSTDVRHYKPLNEEDRALLVKPLPYLHKDESNALQSKKNDVLQAEMQNSVAISYHTLKRMQLAKEHPGMIKTNVLAECQGTDNMLEAKLLQVAAGEGKKQPLLNVVPLFEEHATMQSAPSILSHAYQNPAYSQHLQQVADAQHNGKIVQQVQIAHSDNARRTSMPGARGFIHAAHSEIREEAEKNTINGKPIAVQFFEGGSHSDAYRNGVRAMSAMVNAFGLHNFTKTTFQGGDLVNYFNAPNSIERVFTRHFTHAASVLSGKLEESHDPVRRSPVIEEIVTNVLKTSLRSYGNHFNQDTNEIGHLFGDSRVDYTAEAKSGNAGSRATKRAGQAGDSASALNGDPIDPNTMRTISFSKAFQYGASIVPSWIGMEHIRSNTNKAFAEAVAQAKDLTFTTLDKQGNTVTLDLKDYVQEDKHSHEKCLTAEGLKHLYDASPAFRDTIDKAAHALMMTSMRDLGERVYGGATDVRSTTLKYFNKLCDEIYPEAFSVAFGALNGHYPGQQVSSQREQQESVIDPLKSTFERCEQYRHLLGKTEKLQPLREEITSKLT